MYHSSDIATKKPFLGAPMPCMATGSLFHTKYTLCQRKRRYGRGPVGPRQAYLAPKSTLWAPASLKIMQQNVSFQRHSDQKAILRCSNALHGDFNAPMMLKSWNHSFSYRKINNSCHSRPRFGPKFWAKTTYRR